MDAADAAALRQIGYRAGNSQNTRIAARRQPHGFGGLREQCLAGIIGRRMGGKNIAVDLRIATRFFSRQPVGLPLSCSGNPRRDIG